MPQGQNEKLPDTLTSSDWIEVEDVPTANLLAEIPRATDFISAALQSNGAVLVRCAQGVSRSVAVSEIHHRVGQNITWVD